jgi:2-phospho-L-lactate guanylyltransferase (CobY/MobA/RfbA family)
MMHSLKKSPELRRKYKQLCKNHKKKILSPILDCETRWNSTYAMLFQAMQMQKVISEFRPQIQILVPYLI